MEENSNVTEQKKKNNGLIIIVLLLVLVCLCLGGYVLYDKVLSNKTGEETEEKNNKEKKEEKEQENKEESINFSESELEKYINYINPPSYGPSEKIYKVESVVASKLSGREKIEYIGNNLRREKLISDENTFPHNNRFLEKDVKEYVEKVYGPGTYEVATFNLGCADYNLASDGYYREAENEGCGGTTATTVKNDVIDYTATKEKLEITTAYVFLLGRSTLYKDYDTQEELGKYTGETDSATINTYLSNYIKTNKDKLNHLKYTFESTDGKNYYFKELSKVK